MGIFNSTFREHIIDELNSRKSHHSRQQVYHPTARVTALVEGNLNGQQLRGFTLGPQDVTTVNKLDQLTNISGNGVVVGTTYMGGNPEPVRIKTKKNLPSPGVTDVSISTQSKGGLVFKATVNLKFYGKEQYDFIYQTFMRPGNPILIEYGHTRTDERVKQFNDLGFFKDLNDVTPFQNDIKQVSKLPAGRSDGRVAGLVSNFKISLNEENEYEASIDIINALEFLYALSPEDTVMSYKDTALADSIKNNFGYQQDEEYDPSFDRIYQMVLADLNSKRTLEEISAIPAGEGGFPSEGYKKEAIRQTDYQNHILHSSVVTEPKVRLNNQITEDVSDNFGAELQEEQIIQNATMEADYTWISLNYALERLLPHILKQSLICKDGSYQTLVGTAAQIKDYSEGRDFVSNIIARRSRRRRLREASKEVFNSLSPNGQFTFLFAPIGKYNLLRSSRIEQLIVNNSALYPQEPSMEENQNEGSVEDQAAISTIQSRRQLGYIENFDVDYEYGDQPIPRSVTDLFKTVENWKDKKLYGSDTENKTTPNEGLFLNYQMVRNAFINSSSVSQAVIRLLNIINTNTNGILKLKMRNISIDEGNSEIFKLVIYDENSLPAKEDDILEIYKFFEDDVSEVISYNFDFSLPQTVAATVLANNFDRPSDNVVGQAEQHQLIYNGYNPNIRSMINDTISLKEDDGCRDDQREKISTAKLWTRDENRRSYDIRETAERYGIEDEDLIKQFERDINNFYKRIIGYREIFPPQMKSQTIRDGLFNTLPTSARLSIKLIGLDGFRFGDMFSARKVLPAPYDENNIFMLTGYKHDITSEGWTTTIDGIMIASTPEGRRPPEPQRPQRELEIIEADFSPFAAQAVIDGG